MSLSQKEPGFTRFYKIYKKVLVYNSHHKYHALMTQHVLPREVEWVGCSVVRYLPLSEPLNSIYGHHVTHLIPKVYSFITETKDNQFLGATLTSTTDSIVACGYLYTDHYKAKQFVSYLPRPLLNNPSRSFPKILLVFSKTS